MLWLIPFTLGIFLGIFLVYFYFKAKIQLEVQKYIQEKIEQIKKETLERSRAVLKGKISEQLITLIPSFPYNPADARFLGNPIDYIIFDGYTQVKDNKEGKIKIIFLDVKKGESAKLSRTEKAIEEAIKNKRVEFATLKL